MKLLLERLWNCSDRMILLSFFSSPNIDDVEQACSENSMFEIKSALRAPENDVRHCSSDVLGKHPTVLGARRNNVVAKHVLLP